MGGIVFCFFYLGQIAYQGPIMWIRYIDLLNKLQGCHECKKNITFKSALYGTYKSTVRTSDTLEIEQKCSNKKKNYIKIAFA